VRQRALGGQGWRVPTPHRAPGAAVWAGHAGTRVVIRGGRGTRRRAECPVGRWWARKDPGHAGLMIRFDGRASSRPPARSCAHRRSGSTWGQLGRPHFAVPEGPSKTRHGACSGPARLPPRQDAAARPPSPASTSQRNLPCAPRPLSPAHRPVALDGSASRAPRRIRHPPTGEQHQGSGQPRRRDRRARLHLAAPVPGTRALASPAPCVDVLARGAGV